MLEGHGGTGDGLPAPLSDESLLDLLEVLVNDRGRTGAAGALGVNYRTVARGQQSRRVSRRMRQVLEEFRDSQGAGADESGIVGGDGASETLRDRAAALALALEEENRELRETVEAQAVELEALRRRITELEEQGQLRSGDDAVEGDQGQRGEWRPPRPGHRLPDAGVVTLEDQPDEEHAFGPAPPVVAERRGLRTGGDQTVSRVDRAVAAVRRRELQTEMLLDFHLTLPPETDPLNASRRQDHLRWRLDALSEARRELRRAKRLRLLRRVLTLGLWRK